MSYILVCCPSLGSHLKGVFDLYNQLLHYITLETGKLLTFQLSYVRELETIKYAFVQWPRPHYSTYGMTCDIYFNPE